MFIIFFIFLFFILILFKLEFIHQQHSSMNEIASNIVHPNMPSFVIEFVPRYIGDKLGAAMSLLLGWQTRLQCCSLLEISPGMKLGTIASKIACSYFFKD